VEEAVAGWGREEARGEAPISAALTSNCSSLRQGNYLRQIGAAVTSNPSTLTLDPAIGNEIREARQTPRGDTEELFQTLREVCRREDRVRLLRKWRGEIVRLLHLVRTLDPQYARYVRSADRAARLAYLHGWEADIPVHSADLKCLHRHCFM
jgi:hypothetical protein